jgi:hypothetical protein
MEFTKTNKLMKKCLSEIEKYWKSFEKYNDRKLKNPDFVLPRYPSFVTLQGDAIAFAQFMLADIIVDRGCYFISYPASHKKDSNPEGEFIPEYATDNRSFHEDYENHFHLAGSFIGIDNHEIGVLITGVAIVEILCLKLKNKFPNEHFQVSISYPVKPFEENDNFIFDDCRISFNAKRENEEVTDDINEFHNEAMGVIEW